MDVTDGELDEFAGQLDAVLDHMRALTGVDTADVTVTEVAGDVVNVTRPDEVRPGLTPAQALARAPAAEDDQFLTPRILGEEQRPSWPAVPRPNSPRGSTTAACPPRRSPARTWTGSRPPTTPSAPSCTSAPTPRSPRRARSTPRWPAVRSRPPRWP